jgi:hypothetical protein
VLTLQSTIRGEGLTVALATREEGLAVAARVVGGGGGGGGSDDPNNIAH